MTVEQFKKNLARLSYLDHNGPSEEYYALRDSMSADYELLEGGYCESAFPLKELYEYLHGLKLKGVIFKYDGSSRPGFHYLVRIKKWNDDVREEWVPDFRLWELNDK